MFKRLPWKVKLTLNCHHRCNLTCRVKTNKAFACLLLKRFCLIVSGRNPFFISRLARQRDIWLSWHIIRCLEVSQTTGSPRLLGVPYTRNLELHMFAHTKGLFQCSKGIVRDKPFLGHNWVRLVTFQLLQYAALAPGPFSPLPYLLYLNQLTLPFQKLTGNIKTRIFLKKNAIKVPTLLKCYYLFKPIGFE